MKISILLPYKENFSPEYPGAVSLSVYETSKISKFKNLINVYGNTNFKKKFNINYTNIDLNKKLFTSQTSQYLKTYIELEKKNDSSIIEVHNRPSYIHLINRALKNRILTLYFHNDPLTMEGSKTIDQRKNLLKICYKIIFNSSWSKKRFLEGLENKFVNSNKLLIIYQSANKTNLSTIKNKKKWITFCWKT